MKGFAIFVTIVIIIYIILNVSVWIWIRHIFQLSGQALTFLRVLFIITVFFFPIGRALKYYSTHPLSLGIQVAGEIWPGLLYWLFLIACLTLVLKLFLAGFHLETTDKWLVNHSHILGSVILTVLINTLIYGFFHARNFQVKYLDIELNRSEYPSFKYNIVQLSDLHLDTIRTVKWWEKIVTEVNSLHPDIIVITGDIIENKAHNLEPFLDGFQRLSAHLGVYATTGNHEFYIGTDEFDSYFKNTHIQILRNTTIQPDDVLGIVAMDDSTGYRSFGDSKPDLKRLISDLPQNLPKILLYHTPRRVEEAMETGIDLQLSGHTHCGQMWPFGYFVRILYKYSCGYYQIGRMHLYVNPGTGFWGPPFRVGTDSVIAAIQFSNQP